MRNISAKSMATTSTLINCSCPLLNSGVRGRVITVEAVPKRFEILNSHSALISDIYILEKTVDSADIAWHHSQYLLAGDLDRRTCVSYILEVIFIQALFECPNPKI